MKVCTKCGDEISTRDGDNECDDCERKARNKKARERRRANDAAMRSIGLTKVRGELGGTYWE